ncbi:hypothetical protein IQ07DRAFT_35409 [Pyrenochaeta sp. DS3sAY3a]|nr:hypothetical protein IQ07DRAFT_35409 [Pyrenochaeta sp. DS3sAY3a]
MAVPPTFFYQPRARFALLYRRPGFSPEKITPARIALHPVVGLSSKDCSFLPHELLVPCSIIQMLRRGHRPSIYRVKSAREMSSPGHWVLVVSRTSAWKMSHGVENLVGPIWTNARLYLLRLQVAWEICGLPSLALSVYTAAKIIGLCCGTAAALETILE